MEGFVWALLGEELVNIKDKRVERGVKCACVCPECKEPLVARHGEKNEWGFAHISTNKCSGFGQSTVHLLAKQYIKDKKYFFIPDSNNDDSTKMIQASDVVAEKSVTTPSGDYFIPDLTVTVNWKDSTITMFIEILYTHAVDDEKTEKIKELDTSCLEINLSDLSADVTEEELDKALRERNRLEWIYNRGIARKEEEQRKQEEEKEQKIKDLKNKKICKQGILMDLDPESTFFCKYFNHYLIPDACKECWMSGLDENGKIFCGYNLYKNKYRIASKAQIYHFQFYIEEANARHYEKIRKEAERKAKIEEERIEAVAKKVAEIGKEFYPLVPKYEKFIGTKQECTDFINTVLLKQMLEKHTIAFHESVFTNQRNIRFKIDNLEVPSRLPNYKIALLKDDLFAVYYDEEKKNDN